jgi:hypothetical protein
MRFVAASLSKRKQNYRIPARVPDITAITQRRWVCPSLSVLLAQVYKCIIFLGDSLNLNQSRKMKQLIKKYFGM